MTTDRGLSFGAVAAAYERFRPGYPAEVADRVLAYARRPIGTALEIGAGTGKATRAFAGRGMTITATEPDAAMLAELRKRVPAGVITEQAAFEELRPAVRAVRTPFLADDGIPAPDGTPPDSALQWPGTELQRSGWFADVQQSLIERHLRSCGSCLNRCRPRPGS